MLIYKVNVLNIYALCSGQSIFNAQINCEGELRVNEIWKTLNLRIASK